MREPQISATLFHQDTSSVYFIDNSKLFCLGSEFIRTVLLASVQSLRWVSKEAEQRDGFCTSEMCHGKMLKLTGSFGQRPADSHPLRLILYRHRSRDCAPDLTKPLGKAAQSSHQRSLEIKPPSAVGIPKYNVWVTFTGLSPNNQIWRSRSPYEILSAKCLDLDSYIWASHLGSGSGSPTQRRSIDDFSHPFCWMWS